jgi:hypothetical protein
MIYYIIDRMSSNFINISFIVIFTVGVSALIYCICKFVYCDTDDDDDIFIDDINILNPTSKLLV